METNPVFYQHSGKYNEALANALKKLSEFKAPEWSIYVKSSPSKERPPFDVDFWHKRSASVLRQVYKRGIVGVGRLRLQYGSRKNRGFAPEKFQKSGGKIIRTILQQAEKAGFLEKASGKKAGRQLTEKGKKFLESIKVEENK
jgi:small subunit ribosomal protein S19e